MTLQQKLSRLKKIIKNYGSCLIAFSGGVDSVFLLKIASSVLPLDKILAVTATSPIYPKEELLFSKKIARSFGVRHKIIVTSELRNRKFFSNKVKRCYYCKEMLFSKLQDMAKESKLNFVLDASNLSDRSDFRPGNIAKIKLNVRSPLQEAKLTKQDLRNLSKTLRLVTWDKPSFACLASRIPYGIKITSAVLSRINQAEKYIRGLGIRQVRLRHYGQTCRIETEVKDMAILVSKRNQLVDKLKKLGYNYVTVDLEGYRTGSLNEVIKR